MISMHAVHIYWYNTVGVATVLGLMMTCVFIWICVRFRIRQKSI